MAASWQFYIDWDDDGDFDQPGEDISSSVTAAEWRLGMRRPWQLVADEAEATLTLKNDDRRFSPENSGSPYAGSLVPQRLVQVRSVLSGGTTVHWTGYIESIQPVPGEYGRRVAVLKASGNKKTLQGTEVFIALQEDVTADTVIGLIMDEVDTTMARSLEAGKTTFSYVGDNWEDGIDAYRAISRLVEAERGRLFLDRGGTMVFWNRHHMLAARTVAGTLDTWHVMEYRYGDDMLNRIGVTCHPRKIGTTNEALWELDEAVTIKAGKSRTFRARYADDSGAQIGGRDVVQPNTGDGSLAYTGGSVSVTSFTAAARSAEITLTNSGSSDATVTTLVVKGKKITSWHKQTVFAEDASSIATYGKREAIFKADLLDSEAQADTVAKYLLGRRGSLFGVVPSITLMNKDSSFQSQMITLKIGDRVRVQDTQTGHDGEHFIMGERHILRNAMQHHEVAWTLEPADASVYWVLGVSRLGVDTKLAY